MFIINGVETELDFTDANVQEAYEKASAQLQQNSDYKGLRAPDVTRKVSENVRAFIDGLFGKGMGRKVLPKDSMRDTMTAIDAIVAEANAQFQQVENFGDRFQRLLPAGPAAKDSLKKSPRTKKQ